VTTAFATAPRCQRRGPCRICCWLQVRLATGHVCMRLPLPLSASSRYSMWRHSNVRLAMLQPAMSSDPASKHPPDPSTRCCRCSADAAIQRTYLFNCARNSFFCDPILRRWPTLSASATSPSVRTRVLSREEDAARTLTEQLNDLDDRMRRVVCHAPRRRRPAGERSFLGSSAQFREPDLFATYPENALASFSDRETGPCPRNHSRSGRTSQLKIAL